MLTSRNKDSYNQWKQLESDGGAADLSRFTTKPVQNLAQIVNEETVKQAYFSTI